MKTSEKSSDVIAIRETLSKEYESNHTFFTFFSQFEFCIYARYSFSSGRVLFHSNLK